MKRVRVAVGQAPYDVVIGAGAVQDPRLRRCLGKGASGIVLSSARVMRLHGRALMQSLDRAGFTARILLLRDGEAAKTADVAARCWEELGRAGFFGHRPAAPVSVPSAAVPQFIAAVA